MAALKTYRASFLIDPYEIMSMFEPEEQEQLLNHFKDSEAVADWIMDGVIDLFEGNELDYQVNEQVYDLQGRLDQENRGEQVYF